MIDGPLLTEFEQLDQQERTEVTVTLEDHVS